MNFIELAPGIVLFSHVMDNPKLFIEELEESVKLNAIRWLDANLSNGTYNSQNTISKNIRNCKVISIPPYDSIHESNRHGALFEIHKFLNNSFNQIFYSYCNTFNANHWTKNEGWQLLKYQSDNFFVNHYDDSKNFQRTISMSFFLNENYEGGEIEFPRFSLKIKPKENQALFFPSNYVYNHKVNNIISGTRYSIVGWWE